MMNIRISPKTKLQHTASAGSAADRDVKPTMSEKNIVTYIWAQLVSLSSVTDIEGCFLCGR